jgi:plastocyanin
MDRRPTEIGMTLQRNDRRRAHLRGSRLALLAVLVSAGALAHDGMEHATTPGAGMKHAAVQRTAAASGSAEVAVANFAFAPAVLTVTPGTRITWTNRDSSPHTVTSRDGRFTSSEGMDTGDAFSRVFDQPGTYEYFCSLHPMMVGKVIVETPG